jgi:anti-sigma factor RsiW
MNQFESQSPCEWMQERIDAYLDGDLSPVESSVADQHLARCPGCAEELQLARQVAGSLRALPAVPCPDSIPDAVRARIGAAGNAQWGVKPWPWYYRWQEFFKRPAIVGVMTAVLFVVITGILGEKQQPPPEFTQAEIEQAEYDAKLALAYLGLYTDRAEETLRNDVLGERVFEPIMRAVKRKHTIETTTQPQGVHNAG